MNRTFILQLKRSVFILTFVLMLLTMCWQTTMHLIDYLQGKYGYEYGCANELFVNYEGGFVRRGLFGELLFLARSVIPFSVFDAVVVLYYLGFALLAGLLLRLFRRNGWSLYLLPFPICLYVYLCDPYFLVGRRDCWLLLMAYLCYYLYYKYIASGRNVYIGLCVMAQLLALLLHEASLFFIFPIIFFHDLHRQYKLAGGLNISKPFFRAFAHWWPVLALVGILIQYHGDNTIARGFWLSWAPYFDVTEELITDSYISRTLVWSFGDNLTMAIWPATWMGYLVWKIPVWPFNLYLFFCTYYLVTRFNTIHLGGHQQKDVDEVQLSNIVLLLFCSMFFFMSFVSCDWGRDFPYWVISSFMFFHFFRFSDCFPTFLIKLSEKLQSWIDESSFLSSQWGYYILLITLPFGFMGASLSGMFPFIPLTLKHILMGQPMVAY